MKKPKFLEITLLSDTAFSAGHGTPGVVDAELLHDEYGLPFVSGKTLRGLLRDSWLSMEEAFSSDKKLLTAGKRVFGNAGDMGESSILRIGDGALEKEVYDWLESILRNNSSLTKRDILEAMTDIRHQTAIERETGAPARATLRAIRVAVRKLNLRAPLLWQETPDNYDLKCLALAALATRHAGLSRNRGLGYVQITLDGDLKKTKRLATFGESVG